VVDGTQVMVCIFALISDMICEGELQIQITNFMVLTYIQLYHGVAELVLAGCYKR
jgi:hypothetical protein